MRDFKLASLTNEVYVLKRRTAFPAHIKQSKLDDDIRFSSFLAWAMCSCGFDYNPLVIRGGLMPLSTAAICRPGIKRKGIKALKIKFFESGNKW